MIGKRATRERWISHFQNMVDDRQPRQGLLYPLKNDTPPPSPTKQVTVELVSPVEQANAQAQEELKRDEFIPKDTGSTVKRRHETAITSDGPAAKRRSKPISPRDIFHSI